MTDPEEQPVLIPFRELPDSTLRAIVEDFCTRDGTDYGMQELSLEEKVTMLMRQLERGDAHLVFEGTSQTLRVISEDERKRQGLQ